MLGLVGFAGASSYAMAQNYVFRSPSIGVKIDSSSAFQEEIKRQEDIEMCYEEEKETKTELVEVERLDLNQPRYIYSYYGEFNSLFDKIEFIRDGEVFTRGLWRKPNFLYGYVIDSVELGRTNYHPTSAVFPQTSLNENGRASDDLHERRYTGDTFFYDQNEYLIGQERDRYYDSNGNLTRIFYEVSFYGDSANYTNELVGYNEVEVVTKTSNYEWCTDNGYETAN